MQKLPSSLDTDESFHAVPPDRQNLPFWYMGLNRGLLFGIGLVGLFFFFSPWAELSFPYEMKLSGQDFASRLTWPWVSAAAWLVSIPLVLSRRSPLKMRGAKLISCFVFLLPTFTSLLLLTHKQTQLGPHIKLFYTFKWGLYGQLICGIAGAYHSLFFGGKWPFLRMSKPFPPPEGEHPVKRSPHDSFEQENTQNSPSHVEKKRDRAKWLGSRRIH